MPPTLPEAAAHVAARGALHILLLALAACSTLPERGWPPRLLGAIEVEHALDAETPTVIQVPASDAHLTILDLAVDPAPLAERFAGGRRLLTLPPGDGAATIRMRYRLFAAGDDLEPLGAARRIDHDFPGGRVIEHIVHVGPTPTGTAADP